MLVHGSLRDEDEYVFSGECRPMTTWWRRTAPLTLFGHTHHQWRVFSSQTTTFQMVNLRDTAWQARHSLCGWRAARVT